MTIQVSTHSSRVIKATPFFFGWLILLAGTLGIIMMGPSQTFSVGLIIGTVALFTKRPQKVLVGE